jgi:hypothetical protein
MSHRGDRAPVARGAGPGDRTRSGGVWIAAFEQASLDRRRAAAQGEATGDRGLLLDSLVMEPRDRLANLGLFGAAAVVWLLVGLVVTSRDPLLDPSAGFLGAGLIGLALALTTMPLFWLAVFARNRRIAYTGDWPRAVRRGGWVGVVVAVLVVLRIQDLFEPALALFIVAMVIVAEATLSVER